jgi:hypothetical protein
MELVGQAFGKYVESDANDFVIFNASTITDDSAYILSPDVLNAVDVGSIVRICVRIDGFGVWFTDTIYVTVTEATDDHVAGIITSGRVTRSYPDYFYPLRTGELLVFSYDNIFEVTRAQDVDSFRTGERVPATGPTFTIQRHDPLDDSDVDDDTDSE